MLALNARLLDYNLIELQHNYETVSCDVYYFNNEMNQREWIKIVIVIWDKKGNSFHWVKSGDEKMGEFGGTSNWKLWFVIVSVSGFALLVSKLHEYRFEIAV